MDYLVIYRILARTDKVFDAASKYNGEGRGKNLVYEFDKDGYIVYAGMQSGGEHDEIAKYLREGQTAGQAYIDFTEFNPSFRELPPSVPPSTAECVYLNYVNCKVGSIPVFNDRGWRAHAPDSARRAVSGAAPPARESGRREKKAFAAHICEVAANLGPGDALVVHDEASVEINRRVARSGGRWASGPRYQWAAGTTG